MDICIEVVKNSNNPKYSIGDIVAAYDANQIANKAGSDYVPKNIPVSMPVTAWLFVTGFPNITLSKINGVMAAQAISINGDIGIERLWNLWDGLPQTNKDEISTQGYTNINYGQLLSITKRKDTSTSFSESDLL